MNILEQTAKLLIAAAIILGIGAIISLLYPVGFVQASILVGVINVMADTMFDETSDSK